MIDDATSETDAGALCEIRIPQSRTMRLLWMIHRVATADRWVFIQTRRVCSRTAPKTPRDRTELAGEEREPLPPTQIRARAGRTGHRLDRSSFATGQRQGGAEVFGTAQDRLVKGLRVAGARTLEDANRYLDEEFLPWWNQHLVVASARAAVRIVTLDAGHDLPAALSQVDIRQVSSDYTIRLGGQINQIVREQICSGLRHAMVRVGEPAGRNGGDSVRLAVSEGVTLPTRCKADKNTRNAAVFTGTQNREKTSFGGSPRSQRPAVQKTGNTGLGRRPDQSHPHSRPVRLSCLHKERRAKTARRTLAFTMPKASAREFHRKHSVVHYRKALRAQRAGKPGCHRALGGLAPTASGANSVASALGVRSGATPFGHRHPTINSQHPFSKEDISTWQKSGHFYLAPTALPTIIGERASGSLGIETRARLCSDVICPPRSNRPRACIRCGDGEALQRAGTRCGYVLLSGAPPWTSERRYSIVAMPPADSKSSRIHPANPKVPPPDEELLMLRALLMSRFHLAVHEEKKEGSVFALELDKQGSRLTPAKNRGSFSFCGRREDRQSRSARFHAGPERVDDALCKATLPRSQTPGARPDRSSRHV